MWTGTSSLTDRVISLRMLLFFSSALIAFITPYLLFPDPYAVLFQLGNTGSGGISRHLLKRTDAVWSGAIVTIGVVCFGDLNSPFTNLGIKALYFGTGTLFFSGLMGISISRYARSGDKSRFWKESDRGRELRSKMGEYFKYPIDPGSIPSFINTVLVGGLGMIGVSIGAAFYGGYGPAFEMIPALGLMLFGGFSLSRLHSQSVRNFYATNAFFNEFFGETIAGKEAESKIQVKQLWWVPSAIKSHVWALLLQLDRKFPAGRVLLVGHLLIWLLAYQRPAEQTLISAWLLFALFHHAIIIISLSEEYAPAWFRQWIGSMTQWILVRMWIQLRWVLILAVSMWVNSLIFGHVSYAVQGGIITFYLLSAAFISLCANTYQKATT
ncbi:hypothetical protein [Rhodohalobacter sp. 8-1]|uniref:hypothetical protein n=1 Tax=Rhodohalobacter sp. 8-1 TaxID=3131972 RepID=UPI0030EB6823